MLLRLAYLAVTNTFAALRLLPMGDRDRDIEILVCRSNIELLSTTREIWDQAHFP